MDDAEADVLAFMAFPPPTGQNTFDKPDRALEQRDQAPRRGRRHLPNEARPGLVGAILLEQNDEWELQRIAT